MDSYVPVIEELFEKAFPDKSTAYIFTADHGMTNWGTHGYRSHHETKIPVIAWGAGIKTTEIPIDIRQIDVAPLISALIGINFPTNSIVSQVITQRKYVGTDIIFQGYFTLRLHQFAA